MESKYQFIYSGLIGVFIGMAALASVFGIGRQPAVTQAANTQGPMIVESFFIEIPGDLIALTNSGKSIIAPTPAGIPLFSGARLKNGLAAISKVRDADGQIIGFATELEVFPDEGLADGTAWDTHWIVTIPGRGALYLSQQERGTALMADILAPMQETGEDWQGHWEATTTVGPGADGRGVILGGTGEFQDTAGSFIEIDRLSAFSTKGEMTGSLELRVRHLPHR